MHCPYSVGPKMLEGTVTTVGIIANPASGKDIRRLIAHGSVFDRAVFDRHVASVRGARPAYELGFVEVAARNDREHAARERGRAHVAAAGMPSRGRDADGRS